MPCSKRRRCTSTHKKKQEGADRSQCEGHQDIGLEFGGFGCQRKNDYASHPVQDIATTERELEVVGKGGEGEGGCLRDDNDTLSVEARIVGPAGQEIYFFAWTTRLILFFVTGHIKSKHTCFFVVVTVHVIRRAV